MEKLKKINYGLIVSAAFIASILIRIPTLNRPLSKHHEFNMAMVLNVCNSWDLKGGPAQVNFCPVIDYGNSGDLYFGKHEMLKDGKLYYASLGPMQFIMPYYFCKLLNLPFTPLSIQLFSIFIEGLTILILYFLLLLIFNNSQRKKEYAALGCIVFCFLPNILWFFSNGYAHETLVLPFYFLVTYYFVKQTGSKNKIGFSDMAGLMVMLLLGIFTDWLMVFIAFSYVLYLLVSSVKLKNSTLLWQSLFIIITSCIAVLLLFYLYSNELGMHNFRNLFLQKLQARSAVGVTEKTGLFTLFFLMTKNIVISYFPLIAFLLLHSFHKKIAKYYFQWHRLYYILLLPPILYTLVFIEFSAEHDYAFLKFALSLIVAFVIVLQYLSCKKKIIFTSGILLLSVLIYFYVNRPGKIGLNGDPYKMNEQIGGFISKNVLPDQFIFSNLVKDNLQAVIYYAKRNVRFFKTREEAMQHVVEFKIVKAVFVTGTPDSIVIVKLN